MTIYSPEAFEFEAQLEEEYKELCSGKSEEAGQSKPPIQKEQGQPLISNEDERRDIRFDILKKKR